MDAERLNWLAEVVLDYAYQIHTDLGPGMLESICCEILADSLRGRGLRVELQKRIQLIYRGKTYRKALRADLVVEGELIVEVRRTRALFAHQTTRYLPEDASVTTWATNFSADSLKFGIKRVVNGI